MQPRLRLIVVCSTVFAATLAAAIALRSDARDGARLDRGTLASRFAADTRNLVVAWDPADPRTPSERRDALFDFTYQTYDTTAWIPQSLFDGSLLTQAIVGDLETIVRDRVGLVWWADNRDVPAYGMAPDLSGQHRLRWTVNCLVCHTAEIDGVAYFGAGNKVFDDRWLAEALKTLTADRWRPLLIRDPRDAALARAAGRILAGHEHPKIEATARGRSAAFAASHVELYMRPNGGNMPPADGVGRGDVKVPPLWHTAAKMPAARWYVDGSFHGTYPLMASSMELEKDRPFEALTEHVIPTIRREFDSVIRHLRPPPYPYAIDRALAEKGRALFHSQRVGCARCHGTYDGNGNVEWPGVHRDVGTDRDRLEVVSDAFVEVFDASPIAAHGQLVKSAGYAATPLTGVWANYPYLHNGSVPTLHHLLGPVSERPAIFEITAARRFDRERVGQVLYSKPGNGRMAASDLVRLFGNSRDWFNTMRPGSSNRGHDVWSVIGTDENRRALIEYLKTL
jgi:mono/diheme cytochrome c family protein